MNMIKITTLLLAFFLGSTGAVAYAEEGGKSQVSPNETIAHIERAKTELSRNDFMPPSEHLKAARKSSEQITGNPDTVKKANDSIIQAQIKANQGDTKGALDELNKTLELYKSLKPEQ
jgi:hypothetical protein